MPTSTDAFTDTVFSPVEQLQGSCHSFTVSKCRFKFGNLQIYCYYSNEKPLTGLWRPSHVVLKMTLSQVYQLWSFVLTILKRDISQNLLNTCKILILLYQWIWHIWYKLYPADTINIHHTSFSTLRPRLTKISKHLHVWFPHLYTSVWSTLCFL